MDRGYIKLYRSIDEWEYRKNVKVFSVWMRLLTMANYESKVWSDIEIKRGQCIVSIAHLSEFCNISIKSVRIALDKLEKSGCILRKGTKLYSIITICNYNEYQNEVIMEEENTQRTSFIFYRSYKEAFDELSCDDRLEMYGAICEYGLDGVIPNFSGVKKALFNLIKPQIDANVRKYNKKVNSKNNLENNINLKISIVPQNE